MEVYHRRSLLCLRGLISPPLSVLSLDANPPLSFCFSLQCRLGCHFSHVYVHLWGPLPREELWVDLWHGGRRHWNRWRYGCLGGWFYLRPQSELFLGLYPCHGSQYCLDPPRLDCRSSKSFPAPARLKRQFIAADLE